MKSWSYKSVTQAAEAQIKSLMDSDSDDIKVMAEGVYILWNSITLGWQNDGDGQRLWDLLETGRERI
jgi:hypothetical protein